MIKSMTGFASLTREEPHATISVTVRAVNHRFLDVQFRLPQACADVEPRLRALLQKRVSRGRVEVTVSVQMRQVTVPSVELNDTFIAALNGALDGARAKGLVAGSLTPGDLLRLPQALIISEKPVEGADDATTSVSDLVETSVDQALTDLDTMRVREGGHLGDDLHARKATLAQLIEELAAAAEDGRVALEARLLDRVAELSSQVPVDQGLIAQEVVRVAQRSDISEEVSRFRGHLAHWDALTGSDEPCGRKLDFLLQEMNREVNTMGSKADGFRVSEVIIAAKAELEKMREQVQNVE